MVDIIPGILEKDVAVIAQRIGLVAPFVSWVQIDIADNTLVPNETFLDFDRFTQLVKADQLGQSLFLEAHLMVASPEKYIRPLAAAGFRRLIAHVECADPRLFLEQSELEDVEVGLALDGPTEIEQIEPFLDHIDTVLVMTIEAGRSGQPFLPETVEKIKSIHDGFPNLPIEVDGGINDLTAKIVKDAGATRLVSTSFIFNSAANISTAIKQLKDA